METAIDPNKWVDAYSDNLYRYALVRVNDQQLAQDLVQETFLAGLKNLNKFEQKSTELTWLTAILKRKVIDHYRKKTTRQEYSFDEPNERFADSKMIKDHWVKEKAPSAWNLEADQQLENEEFMQIVKACIEHLPEKWASCFVLKVMEEMKSDEVCKELGITSSNLWVILHRARLQLRDCVEKGWL